MNPQTPFRQQVCDATLRVWFYTIQDMHCGTDPFLWLSPTLAKALSTSRAGDGLLPTAVVTVGIANTNRVRAPRCELSPLI